MSFRKKRSKSRANAGARAACAAFAHWIPVCHAADDQSVDASDCGVSRFAGRQQHRRDDQRRRRQETRRHKLHPDSRATTLAAEGDSHSRDLVCDLPRDSSSRLAHKYTQQTRSDCLFPEADGDVRVREPRSHHSRLETHSAFFATREASIQCSCSCCGISDREMERLPESVSREMRVSESG